MLVRIGNATDVADGQMRVFDVAGTNVNVSNVNVSNVNGRLYAFDDTCTLMGCSLADGELDGTTVTCACHDSQFDVTSGDVLRGPAQRPVRSHSRCGGRSSGDAHAFAPSATTTVPASWVLIRSPAGHSS